MIYTCNFTQATYNRIRLQDKNHNADIWPVYNSLLEFRKERCTPKNIVFREDEVVVPVSDVLLHQILGILTPEIKERMSVLRATDENVDFTFLFKVIHDL